MVEHLLEPYVDLTDLQPSVTFNPVISERSGPALEFLRRSDRADGPVQRSEI